MILLPHPAAELFPMLADDRFADLVASVKARGLLHPIVLCEGKILDGRNRYRACLEAGVEPRTVDFTGDNPFTYVWDTNGVRRDLDPGQRVAVRLRVKLASDEWETERQRKADEANKRRSEAAKVQIAEQPRTPSGKVAPKPGAVSLDTRPGKPAVAPRPVERARESLASECGVSEATAARVQALATKRPDLLNKVADGEIKLPEAMRQVKREEVSKRVEALPSDKYRVIYADPPWQYNDSRAGLDDYAATAAEDHYPTMPTAAICALDVKALADDDAVLFCWATFPLLPDALDVVKAWGFKYKTAFVWSKGRPNFGHYHTADAELLLVATRGSCTPDAEKRDRQVQAVERTGKHSSKPEEFRALIDRLYRGKRIELFRRGAAPDGWAIWGNEAAA